MIFKTLSFVSRLDKLEGDIKLSPNVESLVADGVEKDKKNEPYEKGAVTNKIYLWTNGIVPYVIDSAFGKMPSGIPE